MKEDRRANLKRIAALHKAMRWAAIGDCSEEFAGCTLGGLALELKARIALEQVYLAHDLPAIQVEIPPGSTSLLDMKFTKPRRHRLEDN